MATNCRVALRKHEAEIRRWVSKGRSDGWIASALGTSASSVQYFRSRRKIRRPARGICAAGEPREPVVYREYEGVLERELQGGRVGAWFDPSVQDDPVYGRAWKGTRGVSIHLARNRILLTRAAN